MGEPACTNDWVIAISDTLSLTQLEHEASECVSLSELERLVCVQLAPVISPWIRRHLAAVEPASWHHRPGVHERHLAGTSRDTHLRVVHQL